MQGGFIKARYKPTNRIEIHRWNEYDFGFDEQYVGDLIFSSNLSFIPVDIRFGPRGAMYVCDWYNPVKGIPNLLIPDAITVVPKEQVEEKVASKISSMPQGMVDGLTRDEILDLLAFLEAGGYQLPSNLESAHH